MNVYQPNKKNEAYDERKGTPRILYLQVRIGLCERKVIYSNFQTEIIITTVRFCVYFSDINN